MYLIFGLLRRGTLGGKVSESASGWSEHSVVVYSLNLLKYLGLFLYAALTAQSGGKAPRFDKEPAEQGTRAERSGWVTAKINAAAKPF